MSRLRISLLLMLLVGLALFAHARPAPRARVAAMSVVSRPAAASASTRSGGSERAKDGSGAAAEESYARRFMADLATRYRYLDRIKVKFGATPRGQEAVAYYTEGEILVDAHHTVDISTILLHEAWHVIDWRDNGRLDWGENLPPVNSDSYLRDM